MDRTQAPCSGTPESQPLDHQGTPQKATLKQRFNKNFTVFQGVLQLLPGGKYQGTNVKTSQGITRFPTDAQDKRRETAGHR